MRMERTSHVRKQEDTSSKVVGISVYLLRIDTLNTRPLHVLALHHNVQMVFYSAQCEQYTRHELTYLFKALIQHSMTFEMRSGQRKQSYHSGISRTRQAWAGSCLATPCLQYHQPSDHLARSSRWNVCIPIPAALALPSQPARDSMQGRADQTDAPRNTD